jgi:hypothetical protein
MEVCAFRPTPLITSHRIIAGRCMAYPGKVVSDDFAWSIRNTCFARKVLQHLARETGISMITWIGSGTSVKRQVWGYSFDLWSSECVSDLRSLHLRLRLRFANCFVSGK